MENRIVITAEQFGLTRLQRVSVTQDRAVVFADSEEYGPVVLKIDTDWIQLEDAYRMLKDLENSGACPVIAFEKVREQITRTRRLTYGVMLSKRILPGTPLRAEASLQKRLRVFGELIRRIHWVDCSRQDYLDWLDGIVKYCQMYHPGTRLEEMGLKAYSICVELYEKYPAVFRLHGDLHHDNILLREDGSYVFIDPKAVSGPEILDIPRFLYNEISMAPADPEIHIRECITKLSLMLDYPREELCKAFYMETVLANLWLMEDGEEPRPRELELAEKILQ